MEDPKSFEERLPRKTDDEVNNSSDIKETLDKLIFAFSTSIKQLQEMSFPKDIIAEFEEARDSLVKNRQKINYDELTLILEGIMETDNYSQEISYWAKECLMFLKQPIPVEEINSQITESLADTVEADKVTQILNGLLDNSVYAQGMARSKKLEQAEELFSHIIENLNEVLRLNDNDKRKMVPILIKLFDNTQNLAKEILDENNFKKFCTNIVALKSYQNLIVQSSPVFENETIPIVEESLKVLSEALKSAKKTLGDLGLQNEDAYRLCENFLEEQSRDNFKPIMIWDLLTKIANDEIFSQIDSQINAAALQARNGLALRATSDVSLSIPKVLDEYIKPSPQQYGTLMMKWLGDDEWKSDAPENPKAEASDDEFDNKTVYRP